MSPNFPQARARWPARLAALGLLLALFAAQLWALRLESPTSDEQAHLTRGLTYLRTGDLRLYIGHPPLIGMFAALPLVFDPAVRLPLDDPSWVHHDVTNYITFPTRFMYFAGNDPLQMLAAARTMIVLLALVLGAVVFRFGADVGGSLAGLAALALLCLDPNLRAHGRLVTTDVGMTALLTASAWLVWRAFRRPGWRLVLAAGFSLGLALLSKYSALVFAPLLAGTVLFMPAAQLPRVKGLRLNWRYALTFCLTAGLTVWALYRFEARPALGLNFPVPLATYWSEIEWQTHDLAATPTFLLGAVNRTGFYAYFPVALLVKTPLPLLALGVLGLARWLRAGMRGAGAWLLAAVLYFAVAVISLINIGYRHLVPLLPLLYLGGGLALAYLVRRSRFGRALAGTLLAWLLLASLFVYPRDLTYFNEIAGGPDGGHRFLLDSNLDWGQDLRQLADYVRTHHLNPLYVSYFGTAPVRYFGIEPLPLPPAPNPAWHREAPAPGWYALSVSVLYGGALVTDPDTFAYFQHRAPDVILGRTIYLYHVLPERGALAVCYNPPPGFGANDARTLFGAAVTRVLNFDCANGLVLPRERTWYLLRGPQTRAVAAALTRLGAQVVYSEPHRADPERAVTIFRLESPAAQAAAYADHGLTPQSFGGRAAFIGYRYGAPLAPGQTAQVHTVWTIEAELTEPLSVFLHLAAGDGFVLGQSDGFAGPYETLQPGDALIQFHSVPYPDVLPDGLHWETGLYALAGAQPRYLLPGGADKFSFAP